MLGTAYQPQQPHPWSLQPFLNTFQRVWATTESDGWLRVPYVQRMGADFQNAPAQKERTGGVWREVGKGEEGRGKQLRPF
jgi:hypothetical protein